MLTLIVDDFGVKYIGKDYPDHLFMSLRKYYDKFTVYWYGSLYCVISLEWNYQERCVNLSMTNYIETLINKFQYQPSNKTQYSPFPWFKPNYGGSKQYPTTGMSPTLSKDRITHIKQFSGKILYYEIMVDITLFLSLSDLETQKTKETDMTLKNMNQLLDYCCGFPNAVMRYT